MLDDSAKTLVHRIFARFSKLASDFPILRKILYTIAKRGNPTGKPLGGKSHAGFNRGLLEGQEKSTGVPLFASKEREILIGNEALKKVRQQNDLKYFDPKKRVTSVHKERWRDAQIYESNCWLRDFRYAKEDNNTLHKTHFDNYSQLKGKIFNNAIELGCGPFTNIRHIAGVCKIKNIHLLDPLIIKYLEHPNCSYKNKRLEVKRRFLGLFGTEFPVTLHPYPIEEFTEKINFDLILMINVLEHCYDIYKIFDRILEISKEGSYFVFYDKYFDIKILAERIKTEYDAGHPLRIEKNVFLDFLEQNFIPLLSKINYFKRFKRGMDASYYGFYHIGYRK